MPEIKGILCDLDGTLVNSEWIHVLAWDVIAERYSLTTPDGWQEDYIGRSDLYQAEKLRASFPSLPEAKELLKERHAIYQEHLFLNSEKLRFPGVREGLETMIANGFKLAVGTNSPYENTVAALRAAAIEQFFKVMVTFGTVKEGKPAPDIYLEAARKLGLSPEECAVLEDTEIGIRSGKAAGCFTLGVATTHSREVLRGADMVFADTPKALEWIRTSGRFGKTG